MPLAYIALGANLDDPVTQVSHAVTALRRLPRSRLLRTSSLYRTAPVGIHDQPDFINAVAAIDTELPAPPSAVHLMLKYKAGWVRPAIAPGDQSFDLYPEMSIDDWHKANGVWID